MSRIVVGLSGGVDSAVTAWLLQRQGHEVVGVFMKNWEADDLEEDCPIAQDYRDVLAIGEVLGIEVQRVNFSREYQDRVFAYFLAEYRAGRTPNPDVLCNAEIKFKAFLDHALTLGADHLATGHYARLAGEAPRRRLLKAVDGNKDQSYFLYRLSQRQIARALFPLGDLTKPAVRELARQAKLPVAEKKDSTGICFIGERPFREFLQRYLPIQPGPMVTPEGKVMGRHQGLMYHTLGQRKGLGIGGVKGGEEGAPRSVARGAPQGGSGSGGDAGARIPRQRDHSSPYSAAGAPWFVAGKNLERNELIVVQGHQHPLLLSTSLEAGDLSWLGEPPVAGRRYGAKTRYRQQDAACEVTGIGAAGLSLRFDQAQWAVTPGQSVVLYDGEVCLGGGIIQSSE